MNSVRHGCGTFYHCCRATKYEGQWCSGKQHGKVEFFDSINKCPINIVYNTILHWTNLLLISIHWCSLVPHWSPRCLQILNNSSHLLFALTRARWHFLRTVCPTTTASGCPTWSAGGEWGSTNRGTRTKAIGRTTFGTDTGPWNGWASEKNILGSGDVEFKWVVFVIIITVVVILQNYYYNYKS